MAKYAKKYLCMDYEGIDKASKIYSPAQPMIAFLKRIEKVAPKVLQYRNRSTTPVEQCHQEHGVHCLAVHHLRIHDADIGPPPGLARIHHAPNPEKSCNLITDNFMFEHKLRPGYKMQCVVDLVY